MESGDQKPNRGELRSNWKKFGHRGEEKRMQYLKGKEVFVVILKKMREISVLES